MYELTIEELMSVTGGASDIDPTTGLPYGDDEDTGEKGGRTTGGRETNEFP